MKLETFSLPLNLRDTFRIARGASDHRNNVLLRLTDNSHIQGLGEAAPSPFYNESAETVTEALRNIQWPEDSNPFILEDILRKAKKILKNNLSALSALDLALHDLLGKRLGIPLYRFLGLNPSNTPPTSITIGIASLDEIHRKVEEAADFPILKIKLGTDDDRAIIETVRQVTSVPIRVDANAAWGLDEAIENINWLKDQNVELLEQPLPATDFEGLKRITEISPLPIIADESVRTPEDVIRLHGCVHGINIKLAKCGGLREALKMIHIARAQGMKVMLGCMVESSLGITAAAHLSPLVDFVDLDGHLLINNDPFSGVQIKKGKIVLPNHPGLGVSERIK